MFCYLFEPLNSKCLLSGDRIPGLRELYGLVNAENVQMAAQPWDSLEEKTVLVEAKQHLALYQHWVLLLGHELHLDFEESEDWVAEPEIPVFLPH